MTSALHLGARSEVDVIGVDCATDDANIGLARGRWGEKGLKVIEVRLPERGERAHDHVSAWVANATGPVLLAMDAPLGWPAALGLALANHRAGQVITADAKQLFRRRTDQFIQKNIQKTPLDVAADRIARTAYAALNLLGEVGRRHGGGNAIPLAWTPTLVARISAIEVYPAATLKVRGLKSHGYKKDNDADRMARAEIVRGLRAFDPAVQRFSSSGQRRRARRCGVSLGCQRLLGWTCPGPSPCGSPRRGA
jgi:hypothetical protein